MSLAPVMPAQATSVPALVDAMAVRSGGWVVIERFGAVVTHGTGPLPCPAPLAEALLSKCSRPLRDAVTWARGGRTLRGTLAGVPVTAVDLGPGATAWFVGGEAEHAVLPLLVATLDDDVPLVRDAAVEALLHPRGPSGVRRAPAAVLLVLTSSTPMTVLARTAAAAVAGTDARVHTESDHVVVALTAGADADAARAVDVVRARCADVVAGLAAVPESAADWAATAELARASARAASRLGRVLGDASDPAVAAEVVVDEAQQSVATLAGQLRVTPLRWLEEHDARTSGELVATLTAWCRAGFDVAAAAAVLHVHPNTLRYRLRRAGELSGLDLSRPRHVLALQLMLDT